MTSTKPLYSTEVTQTHTFEGVFLPVNAAMVQIWQPPSSFRLQLLSNTPPNFVPRSSNKPPLKWNRNCASG